MFPVFLVFFALHAAFFLFSLKWQFQIPSFWLQNFHNHSNDVTGVATCPQQKELPAFQETVAVAALDFHVGAQQMPKETQLLNLYYVQTSFPLHAKVLR